MSARSPLAARRRMLLDLPPARRLEAILDAERPRDLVRALPPAEFFLTLAESGIDAALPLLPLASARQLDVLFDLDAWRGSLFDAEGAARWIGIFAAADPGLVARWLREGDEDTVVVALSRLLRVYKLDPEVDPRFFPPDRPLESIDGLYFLEPAPGADPESFRPLALGLTRLRAAAPAAYEALLEQVLWILPTEREEAAYERRCARLAEHGFPELDEALEVWAAGPESDPASRRRLAERLRQAAAGAPSAAHETGGSALTRFGDAALPVLSTALRHLPPERVEEVTAALAALGNRYAVASLGHLGDLETHREGLRTALSHLQLGLLEIAPEGEPVSAAALLSQVHPREIARAGVGAILERAARARRLERGWLERVHLAHERLDPELAEPLEALLAPRPLFGEPGGPPRPFRDRTDLEAVDTVLDTIEALGEFLERELGAGRRELPEFDPLPAGRVGPEALEWSAVAITTIARHAAGERPARPRPLGRDDLARAAARLLTPGGVAPAFHDAARALRLDRASPWLAQRLSDDAGALEAGAGDPRAVRALLLAPGFAPAAEI